jgi:hypothetical protein
MSTMKIKALGRTIKVSFEKPGMWAGPMVGRCSPAEDHIVIDKQYPGRSQASVLLHEIVHWIAIDCSLGFKDSEQDVSTLATVLYEILAKNPRLVQFLTKGE